MIQKYKSYFAIILSVAFIAALGLLYYMHNENQILTEKNKLLHNNIKAEQDSIRTLKFENGILSQKLSFQYVNDKDFINQKPEIAKEFKKELNLKNLENVENLTKISSNVKDTIKPTIIFYTNNDKSINFNIEKYNDFGNNNTRLLKGYINYKNKDSIDSQFTLEQNITYHSAIVQNKDGQKEFKITTDYPGVKFTEINNYELNSLLNIKKSKNKHIWGFGITAGWVLMQKNNTIQSGPGVAVGLTFSPKLTHN